MPEAEFWAELLTELRNSPYHSPEISAKAAALIDAGWMEELSGKIVIPRVDPSGEVTLEQPVTFEPWGDYWIRRQGETMQFGSQRDPEGPWFDTVEDFTRYLEEMAPFAAPEEAEPEAEPIQDEAVFDQVLEEAANALESTPPDLDEEVVEKVYGEAGSDMPKNDAAEILDTYPQIEVEAGKAVNDLVESMLEDPDLVALADEILSLADDPNVLEQVVESVIQS